MKRNGKQFYTIGGDLIDISSWDTSLDIKEYNALYGWQGAMAFGNLIQDELNQYGPGVQPGDIYLDLGANIGMSALRAEMCGASKLYCIEPDVSSCNALELNKNKHWEIFNFAIADYNGVVNIAKWPNWWDKMPCPCITLEKFFNRHNINHIDFMKIDIEAHEFKVLPSIPISVYDKIDKIFLEYHEDVLIREGKREKKRTAFIKTIKDKGYNNHHVALGFEQSHIYFWK